MISLVTGATGFIGAAVVRRLLQSGYTVRVLVRAHSDRRNLQGLAAEPVSGDLSDRASLEHALRGCRYVFHLAADYRLWVPKPASMYATNVTGTRNLMLAALQAGIERIVYTSSVATLGLPPDGGPGDEDTPVTLADMIGHYKRSKFLAEAAVLKLYREHGLPVVIVNPSTPIGPGDIRPTPTGRMLIEAASGRMPAYVDTGLNLVAVDDVAQGHLLALERGRLGERYVLGGENLSLRQILVEIARLTGRRPPGIRVPYQAVLPLAYLLEAWARLWGGKEPLVTV
ncbi:MAG TPA: hopanoid-associated sugar epimerase, partial [Candidatus Competibacteraceae bacterium]|nr:hopanoid-associated sugar epimerase [Candidatus Competibacteraceae bacterium]